MEHPPFSPLPLDGSGGGGLDGWDIAEEDFDMDFDDLFRDAEIGQDQLGDQGQQDRGQKDQVDIGDDGGSSSIAAEDVDLRSLSEASPTAPNINQATVIEGAATTTTWSTTSLSEDSDDGSRSSICGSSCALGGVSPASGPTPAAARSSSTGSSNVEIPPPAPRSVTSEASTSTANNDAASINSKRLLSVSSGAGTPILPFAFAPAFGQTSSSSLSGLHAAALAAAGKLFGHAAPSPPGSAEAAAASTPSRLLGLGRSCGEKEDGRASKRTKREERLMKNREAANRSRVKRKEVLSELENRVNTLSTSLADARDETAALKQEIASLREQNSFLRGMLSVQGNGTNTAVDLPAVPSPTSTPPPGGRYGGGRDGGGRGASPAAAGASAILGAVGTGLGVISCVALSAGFGGGHGHNLAVGNRFPESYGGMGTAYAESGMERDAHGAYASRGGGSGGKMGSSGGRRMLLAVEDGEGEGDYFPADGDAGGGDLGGWGVERFLFLGLLAALVLALLVVVARWAYRTAAANRRHASSLRGRRRSRALRGNADSTKGRGVWGADYLGGLGGWAGLLSAGDNQIRKAM